jgi:poly-gamma-glutamate synthesis protein (capsule biosynthesis protein)
MKKKWLTFLVTVFLILVVTYIFAEKRASLQENYKIPRDARASLQISPAKKMLLNSVILAEKLFKFWDYPFIHDPEKMGIKGRLYWVNKTISPVRKAQKGTEIEKSFMQNQQLLYNQVPTHQLSEKFKVVNQIECSAVGDLMNANGIEHSRDKFYQKVVNQIFDVDLSIANLESSLTSTKIEKTAFRKDEMPKINATFEQYMAFTRHENQKFTVFHTANNHILDNGLEGFNTTHDQIEKDGFKYFGTNRTAEAHKQGLIISKNGIRVGLIGFTYSLNLRDFPPGHEYLVNTIPFHNLESDNDLSPIQRQIDFFVAQKVDFIIVSLHWGMEYEFYPTAKQMRQAHAIAEMGADMIISHHAHCIQPVEFYHPKRDANRIIPILYGLGNLTAITSAPHSILSLISNFTIVKGLDGTEEKTYLKYLELTPVFQWEHISDSGNFLTLERLADYVNTSIPNKRMQSDVKKMVDYANQVLGTKWALNN